MATANSSSFMPSRLAIFMSLVMAPKPGWLLSQEVSDLLLHELQRGVLVEELLELQLDVSVGANRHRHVRVQDTQPALQLEALRDGHQLDVPSGRLVASDNKHSLGFGLEPHVKRNLRKSRIAGGHPLTKQADYLPREGVSSLPASFFSACQ